MSENGASMTDFGSLPNLRCLMTNDDNLIDGNEMHLLACSVYHSLLKHLPALVRPQLGQNNLEFAFEFKVLIRPEFKISSKIEMAFY